MGLPRGEEDGSTADGDRVKRGFCFKAKKVRVVAVGGVDGLLTPPGRAPAGDVLVAMAVDPAPVDAVVEDRRSAAVEAVTKG